MTGEQSGEICSVGGIDKIIFKYCDSFDIIDILIANIGDKMYLILNPVSAS